MEHQINSSKIVINNEEAALMYRYFLLLNNAESEIERHSLCKELLQKLETTVERKNNFISLLRSFGITDFKVC
jgi:hypothetical protein